MVSAHIRGKRTYRLTVVTTSLLIVVGHDRCLSQGLTVDFRDSPRRQVAESRIKFAGNWATERMQLWFRADSFGSIASPGKGNKRGLAGVVEQRRTGGGCEDPSTEHSGCRLRG